MTNLDYHNSGFDMNDTHNNPTTGEQEKHNERTSITVNTDLDIRPSLCGDSNQRRAVVDNPTTGEIETRITEYLSAGGLFNPELMEHEKVRDLLMDCRAALTAVAAEVQTTVTNTFKRQLTAERERYRKLLDAERRRCFDLEQQLATTERTLEAAYENHKADVERLNADYTRELNAKLAQINAQAGMIKELSELLKQVEGYLARMGIGLPEYLVNAIDNRTYPLPDGRTK